MLNTIYSLKEVSAYNKMIRLFMHGGQKNKAVQVFLNTVLKILQKKKIVKASTDQKVSPVFRRYRVFDQRISYDSIKWLGLDSAQFIQIAVKRPIDTGANTLGPIDTGANTLGPIDTGANTLGPIDTGANTLDSSIRTCGDSAAQALFLRFEKEKVVNIFSIMENAILNVSPFLEVRKVRVSGKTRQIPSMIQKNRQQTLAIRWLIEAAKNNKKKNKTFADCLATEFLEAADKRGGARQKRNELHKVAHSNRTFLRYRWW
jgi:small subunit ribosomal protein S7